MGTAQRRPTPGQLDQKHLINQVEPNRRLSSPGWRSDRIGRARGPGGGLRRQRSGSSHRELGEGIAANRRRCGEDAWPRGTIVGRMLMVRLPWIGTRTLKSTTFRASRRRSICTTNVVGIRSVRVVPAAAHQGMGDKYQSGQAGQRATQIPTPGTAGHLLRMIPAAGNGTNPDCGGSATGTPSGLPRFSNRQFRQTTPVFLPPRSAEER